MRKQRKNGACLYSVYAVSGTVRHWLDGFSSYAEAEQFCDEYGWQFDYNGGLWWDMEIHFEYVAI